MQNIENEERILRAAKGNGQVYYKGKPIRITPKFFMEIMKSRRPRTYVLETKKRPQTPDPPKLSTTINGENKIFHGKTRFKQYLSTNPVIQKVLEGKLQPKEANCKHRQEISPHPQTLKKGNTQTPLLKNTRN